MNFPDRMNTSSQIQPVNLGQGATDLAEQSGDKSSAVIPEANDEINIVADDLYQRVTERFSRCEEATQENIAHEFYLIAARIATEERERCAQIAEGYGGGDYWGKATPIAAAIRLPKPPVSEASK